MKLYTIEYKRFKADDVQTIEVRAKNKYDAYDKAVYEILAMPYSAWVAGVTYKNGKVKRFNTHEGMPY